MPPLVPPRAAWTHNLPAVLATVGGVLVQMAVVIWSAASLTADVRHIGARLATIETALEQRTKELADTRNWLARIEGRLEQTNRKGAN